MSSIIKVDTIQDAGGNQILTSDGSGVITGNLSARPAFEAYLGSDQTLTNATITKVEFDTEILDTDNCYDNSTNYRFTPTVAGKYYVYTILKLQSSGTDGVVGAYTYIYKNGSSYKRTQFATSTHQPTAISVYADGIIDMNGSSDYIEIFGYCNQTSGSPRVDAGTKAAYFGAYKLPGV